MEFAIASLLTLAGLFTVACVAMYEYPKGRE